MDVAVGLRLMFALLFLFLTHGVLLPYFWRPKEFFIKPLRAGSDDAVTHPQLLFRAFIGVGLISTGFHSAAFFLAFGLFTDLSFEVWLIPTLGVGLVLGAGSYIGFKFGRYRKLTPTERQSTLNDVSGNFIRRRP